MKRIVSILSIIIFLSILISCYGCVGGENKTSISEETEPSTKDDLSQSLDTVIDNCNFKGVACVYYNGEKVYESNTGYSDIDLYRENSSDEVYRIASLAKEFTAVAICKLYEDGKLDLDDTLDKYFDNTAYGSSVKVKDLLNMSSGIPDYTGNRDKEKITYEGTYKGADLQFKVSADNTANDNKNAIRNWILSQNLNFTPQEKFEYSNSNYFLLGEIIEKVSGEYFEDYITETIIKPLNLKNTGFDESLLTANGYVYDSTKTEDELLEESDTAWTLYPGVMFASADMYSTTEDLYIWISAFLEGKVVSPDTVKMMTENNRLGFGYGFFTNDLACYNTGHVGSFMSYLGFARNIDFIVITLSNTYSDNLNYANLGVLLGNAALEKLL